MVGHITLPNVTGEEVPASLSREVTTSLLREELGFRGVAITDSLDMGAITQNYPAGEAAVDGVRLGNMRLDDLGAGGNVLEEALVTRELFGILRRIDHRLPAELRQVFAELHPTLNPRTTGRGPVICDDQQSLQH